MRHKLMAVKYWIELNWIDKIVFVIRIIDWLIDWLTDWLIDWCCILKCEFHRRMNFESFETKLSVH